MVILPACAYFTARADPHSSGLRQRPSLPNKFLMRLEFILGSCAFMPKSNNLFIREWVGERPHRSWGREAGIEGFW